ncbi:MAG: hypothetical protein ILP11_04290 [Alphaproteobacteria bacterium]|nr:hypothetical protein [Alphaproteobacteria bacterium]
MKKILIVVALVAVGFLGYQFYVRKLAGQQQATAALLPVNVWKLQSVNISRKLVLLLK